MFISFMFYQTSKFVQKFIQRIFKFSKLVLASETDVLEFFLSHMLLVLHLTAQRNVLILALFVLHCLKLSFSQNQRAIRIDCHQLCTQNNRQNGFQDICASLHCWNAYFTYLLTKVLQNLLNTNFFNSRLMRCICLYPLHGQILFFLSEN